MWLFEKGSAIIDCLSEYHTEIKLKRRLNKVASHLRDIIHFIAKGTISICFATVLENSSLGFATV